jgi:cytidylate kinase
MASRSGLATLKVWLAATPEVRAERVAQRESKSAAQALKELRVREGSEARRYEEFHQIDISDLSIYDVFIETDKTDPNAVVALIMSRLKSA